MLYFEQITGSKPAFHSTHSTRKILDKGLGILLAIVMMTMGVAYAETQGEDALRGNYVLGVGDVIRVTVHGEEDLALETRLDNSGMISYPFLGEMRAVGSTVLDLENRITSGLKPDYLIDPEVQVSVIEYRNFYINGEVRRPGGYPYTPGLTVQKAAAIAGGFTERASHNKMYIIPEDASRRLEEPVDLDTHLNPGDTLIVEEGLF